MHLRHLQQLTELLNKRGDVLERAVEGNRLSVASDVLRLGTLRQDQEAARQVLADRVKVAQASAKSLREALQADARQCRRIPLP